MNLNRIGQPTSYPAVMVLLYHLVVLVKVYDIYVYFKQITQCTYSRCFPKTWLFKLS